MLRYLPRLVPPRTAPPEALVLPLIEDPPASPLGEHELIPQVAWMVERDGVFVHVPATERTELEMMRGSAIMTMLDGDLTNEVLEHVPGTFATSGAYAAELLLDGDHLTQLRRPPIASARSRYSCATPRTTAVVGELQLAALAQAGATQ